MRLNSSGDAFRCAVVDVAMLLQVKVQAQEPTGLACPKVSHGGTQTVTLSKHDGFHADFGFCQAYSAVPFCHIPV